MTAQLDVCVQLRFKARKGQVPGADSAEHGPTPDSRLPTAD